MQSPYESEFYEIIIRRYCMFSSSVFCLLIFPNNIMSRLDILNK